MGPNSRRVENFRSTDCTQFNDFKMGYYKKRIRKFNSILNIFSNPNNETFSTLTGVEVKWISFKLLDKLAEVFNCSPKDLLDPDFALDVGWQLICNKDFKVNEKLVNKKLYKRA